MKKNTFIISMIAIIVSTILINVLYYNVPEYKSRIKIGTTNMTMNNSFYVALNSEIKKVVNEHGDILYMRNPVLDVDKQVNEIYDLIKLKIDVLIINPVDGYNKKLINALKNAKEHDVKIIVVDSRLKDESFVDCTILSDNYNAGVICAKDMMKNYTQAHILVIEHHSAISAVERIDGFMDTIKPYGQYQVVKKVDGLGQTERVMPLVKEALKQGVSFDTIMSLNDPSTLGALAALEESRKLRHIKVYSVDGSPDMKKLIMDSQNDYKTAAQSPIKMGRKAIEIAYLLMNHQKVDKEITIPVYLISQDNLSSYEVSGWQ